MYFCNVEAEFSAAITLVLSVTYTFCKQKSINQ